MNSPTNNPPIQAPNSHNANVSLNDLPLQEDAREALHHAFKKSAMHAAELGFEYCAWYVRFPLPISQPAVVTLDTYSPTFSARYRTKNYLAVDPTFKHARNYQSPVVWSEKLFAKAPPLWRDLQASGLKAGWAFPARDARNVVSLLTVARAGEQIGRDEIREKQSLLAWIAQTTHLGITRHLAPLAMPSVNATLSRREIDVLRWTAEGKTAHEISRILSISERTVHFHANNAVAKLCVTNKTAAVAHATVLGIL